MSAARAQAAQTPAPEAIGICTSAGGPVVLTQVLGALPADFPLPILVVQHIASGFTEDLVRMLDARCALPVRVAVDGAALGPGAWFAPDDAHLMITRTRRMALDARTVAGLHRPSADLLLESLASVYGSRAVAIVLTGMGRDGARGAALVKERGGLLLAQDEATSSVYGMPRAAVEAGALPLPPPEIVAMLREMGEAASR